MKTDNPRRAVSAEPPTMPLVSLLLGASTAAKEVDVTTRPPSLSALLDKAGAAAAGAGGENGKEKRKPALARRSSFGGTSRTAALRGLEDTALLHRLEPPDMLGTLEVLPLRPGGN